MSEQITYTEKRTINIGQYENITATFSYSGNIKAYNRVDKTVEISSSETTIIKDKQDFTDSAKLIVSRVQKVLNRRERDIRLTTQEYINDTWLERKALNAPSDRECI